MPVERDTIWLDWKKVEVFLGVNGASAVRGKIGGHSKTVESWKQRGTIPWDMAPQIAGAAGRTIDDVYRECRLGIDAAALPRPRTSAAIGSLSALPLYVREMVNIPPRYFEELSEKRLELLVESLRYTAGRTAEELRDLTREQHHVGVDPPEEPDPAKPSGGQGQP